MATGDDISSDLFNVRSIFQVHTDTSELSNMVNALGYMIDNTDKWAMLSREQMEAVGHNTVEFARALAPERSGALQSSIDFNIIGNNKSLEVFASATDVHGYPYGASIEYGFHPHGGHYYIAPRPFMRPALGFATELTMKTLAQNAEFNLADLTHWGSGKTKGAWIGNRTLPQTNKMYKFSGSAKTVQRGDKYLRGQYQRNKESTIINRSQKGSGLLYRGFKNTGFTKGAWRNTVWGSGDRGRR